MSQNYRVEDKQNINNGGRRTMFKLFKRQGDAFVYAGNFSAKGWDADDSHCISSALDTLDAKEEAERFGG